MSVSGITGWICKRLGTGGRPERPTEASQVPDAASAPGVLVIDVRSPAEFRSGHLEGALSLPLDRIESDIRAVAPDRKTPLIVYCRSGARSARACAVLQHLGYESVRNGGGITSLSLTLNRAISHQTR